MGFCFSCCRRQKPVRDPEQEPLLKHAPADSHVNGPPRTTTTHLDKAADVVAALKAGKLPAQDQIHGIAKELLTSDFLKTSTIAGGALDASLAVESEKLVNSVREAIEAVLQLGMEKNGALNE